MSAQLVVAFVVDGRLFEGAVHSLDLTIIRYVISGGLFVRPHLRSAVLW